MIIIRDAQPEEAAHIIDSWARSFYRLTTDAGRKPQISPHVWHQIHRAGIGKILGEPDVIVRVACHDQAPDGILGWICWQPPTEILQLYLHYVCVKQAYRRRGIGLMLVREALSHQNERGYIPTHRTSLWHKLSTALHEEPRHALAH